VNIDGNWYAVGLQRIGETSRYVLTLNDRVLEVLVSEEQQGFNLQIAGRSYEVETTRRRGPRREEQAQSFVDGSWNLISPLTGVVNELRVEVGNHVEAGDVIAVVEAMKMLNDLRSRVSGVVSLVHVQEKDRVELGQRLIEISEHQPPV
jgi:biotin carboxyl carrier protein